MTRTTQGVKVMDLINNVILVLAGLIALAFCVALVCGLIDLVRTGLQWRRIRRELWQQLGRIPTQVEVGHELVKRWRAWDELHPPEGSMQRLSEPYFRDITGTFMPWLKGQPVVIHIEGEIFVPVFSSVGKLHASVKDFGDPGCYSIKVVDNGNDFLASINEAGISVCLDPHRDGKVTRFTLCVLPHA